jgi:hypothetical protein
MYYEAFVKLAGGFFPWFGFPTSSYDQTKKCNEKLWQRTLLARSETYNAVKCKRAISKAILVLTCALPRHTAHQRASLPVVVRCAAVGTSECIHIPQEAEPQWLDQNHGWQSDLSQLFLVSSQHRSTQSRLRYLSERLSPHLDVRSTISCTLAGALTIKLHKNRDP